MMKSLKNIMILTVACLALTAAASAQPAGGAEPAKPAAAPGVTLVKVQTTLGDFTLELYPDKTPASVANFVRYAREGYYEGTVFHRVMPTFMIQGGGFTKDMNKKEKGLHPAIANESSTGLENKTGVIAMARTSAPNSATSQFFINVTDNAMLDRNRERNAAYTGFGKVVEGMETIEKIRDTPVEAHPKYRTRDGAVTPVTPVVIEKVTVLQEGDLTEAMSGLLAGEKAADEAARKAANEQDAALEKKITELEQKNGKSFTKTDSGLMIMALREGSGETTPSATSRVRVHYEGSLLDGSVFDSSYKRGKPAEFGLNQVIKGWQEGVGMMKPGEKAVMIIPPTIGYGERGAGASIPPNSFLVFTVELIDIL